jgi:hypothetical protein
MEFNFGVVPAKTTEISYNGSRIEYSVISWRPPGTFAVTTFIKILYVATVDNVIKQYAQRHEQRLYRHINVEALQLLQNDGLVRRLQRTKPFELV